MKALPFSLILLAGAANAEPQVSQRLLDDYKALQATAKGLKDPAIRTPTVDALTPGTCIRHRANLSDADKAAILGQLAARGFVADTSTATMTGVFPPLNGDGTACPTSPQSFAATPGGTLYSHHGWPGGLPEHELLNQRIGADLSKRYARAGDVPVDGDLVSAAAIWHDWAKIMVFQWKPDGTLLSELRIGGPAATGSHHILGIAETMARGLSPRLVITQACAHAAPLGEDAPKFVVWLEAAAIIARVDPVKAGYLRQTDKGLDVNWSTGLTGESGIWRECLIHTASDDNYRHSHTVSTAADDVLKKLAPQFGYDPAAGNYLMKYRHVAMSELGGDRIQALLSTQGEAAVLAELQKLRKKGLF
ncbi:hypothetical protein PQU92_15445 [Asticcacaulis sp. BYS171W]|uniref:HD domain-containing protein n=1 Tax=Asticcacaulis aquaticus TaxID=2984212 RepID=A0ABT5HXV1_9CAUL|nr:hypothetical protein [Asticcacaulis aquaticus]MDC7684680.1 hypothetical protein [Asticcacaulis aquaticus]